MRIVRYPIRSIAVLVPVLMMLATGCSRTISTYGGDKQSQHGQRRAGVNEAAEARQNPVGQPHTGRGSSDQDGGSESSIPSLSRIQHPDPSGLGKSTGEERIVPDAIVTAPSVSGSNGSRRGIDMGAGSSSRGGSGKSGMLLDGARADEIDGLSDVFFGFDSAVITDAGKQALLTDVRWLQSHPDVSLFIEGHCDERGTNAYNLILGEKRAKAIRTFLGDQRLDRARFTVVSYGKERPFCQAHDESCYRQNRRAHFGLRD